ncbi:hypothetical protein MUK42_33465 [Musa troglodytarum]|uniref:Uncharacterized protein n=1 Tax=Musa troglodytarum TaxID=320322 RepID=A0A9E7FGH8_9LILI|nr:hypothetical protein MUK42_33465 [Musa troglodytarum]
MGLRVGIEEVLEEAKRGSQKGMSSTENNWQSFSECMHLQRSSLQLHGMRSESLSDLLHQVYDHAINPHQLLHVHCFRHVAAREEQSLYQRLRFDAVPET